MKEELVFKPRARLLLQLGDELIRNESIALLELVKNAYDADSTNVSLEMKSIDSKENGFIVIEDDGNGMDLNTIRDVWMEPGSDYKTETKRKITKKFGRSVLGEKGIGRFAVHKLGDVIELITRKKGEKEVYIKIDWTVFKKSRYLQDVPITIEERTPHIFTETKTGTRIVIRGLRNPWTRAMLREVYRAYNSLRSPYDSPSAFKIEFETDKKEWLEGMLSWKEVEDFALFKFSCDIEGDTITKFRYEFMPWKSMEKLKRRVITEKGSFGKVLKMKDKDNNPIDISKHKIGKIHFEGKIFDQESRILKLGLLDKPEIGESEGLRGYLHQNGGIKVFRDGVRIYDYGEPNSDWLALDIRRVNMPTKRISNNLIIASVLLDRKKSEDLIEKTNREGFIENDAYLTFVQSIIYAVEKIEDQRKIDKEKIRMYYGPTPKSEPVITKIADVKKIIEKKVKDKILKKELSIHLDRIEEDYKTIHSTLLRSAGAGLSLSVAVHEMDKVIGELMKILTKEHPSDRIVMLVKHLGQLVEGYTLAIRKSAKQTWTAYQLIDQSLFNFEFRFKAHKIKVIFVNADKAKKAKIKCSRSHIIGSIMNVLDNSIWWLDYGEVKEKKIFISVYTDSPRYITILIADNGPGFSLPTDILSEPGVTSKPDGMGLGLHIAKEIMIAHDGRLLFPEWGDYEIQKEFRKGAIIAFAFRRETKK